MILYDSEIEQLGRPKTKFGRVMAGVFTGGISEIAYGVQKKRELEVAAQKKLKDQALKQLETSRQIMQNEPSPIPKYAAAGVVATAALILILKKKKVKK